jgi:hypothetical protein
MRFNENNASVAKPLHTARFSSLVNAAAGPPLGDFAGAGFPTVDSYAHAAETPADRE